MRWPKELHVSQIMLTSSRDPAWAVCFKFSHTVDELGEIGKERLFLTPMYSVTGTLRFVDT